MKRLAEEIETALHDNMSRRTGIELSREERHADEDVAIISAILEERCKPQGDDEVILEALELLPHFSSFRQRYYMEPEVAYNKLKTRSDARLRNIRAVAERYRLRMGGRP